jgi:hypothetical protein
VRGRGTFGPYFGPVSVAISAAIPSAWSAVFRCVRPRGAVVGFEWPSRAVRARTYAASHSPRYRYRVARLTPRYFAMSLPVCPSAFIRVAVAMCSASATLRGRPNFVPLVRDDARFKAVRSLISSRLHGIQDGHQVAAQTVELPDHHGVTLADVGHQLGQTGPVSAPDMTSEKVLLTPTATSASFC